MAFSAIFQVIPTKAVAMIFRSDERAARKPKLPPTDFGTGDRGYSTSRVPTRDLIRLLHFAISVTPLYDFL